MDLRPILQIPPDSYIGQTLNNIHHLGIGRRRSGNDPSSSDSSELSSESESNSSDSDKTSDRKKLMLHKRRSQLKRSNFKRSYKLGLKPIAPRAYDGLADAHAYNRFVTEGTAYVVNGRVPQNRQVFVLSYFLEGTTYDFYTQKVSMNFAEWRLKEFFEELFNYCFPINYRTEQRLRLKKCFQKEKRVSAYVHELKELYNMIGAVDEREKVIKLWYGLWSSIQQDLWRDRLNPETSTWEEIVAHASIIEIAQNVSKTKDEGSDAEYDSITEYSTTSSDSEYQSDPEYAPNPPRGNQLGNFPGRMRKFQPNQPGSRVLHRSSTEQPQPPRDDGHFGSSKPRSSNNAIFGKRASSRGISDSRFTPKPFEKSKLIIKEEEKAELMALGKCFICKETGHLARDCPGENAESSSSSELPAVSNLGIGFEEVDEEDSDEVEALSTLRVSAINFISSEESPEERNVASGTPDQWGAKNDIIIPADRRSVPLNIHISDQVPEMTGIQWASPERLWELSAQVEVPRVACPMGDVDAVKDLEGARFTLADSQNSIRIIADNKLEHIEKTDYFAFRGLRQRKEGEGQPNTPRNMDLLLPQTFLGSIQLLNSFHFVDFNPIPLFSLFKLGFSYVVAFYYRLVCFISSFIRISSSIRVPKIVGIHPLDDSDTRFLVSNFLTCDTPRITVVASEQLRFLLEPIPVALTPIAYNAAITNTPADSISFEPIAVRPVPLPVVHIRVDASTLVLTADDNKFKTITHQPHSDVTHATVENWKSHGANYPIFVVSRRFFHPRTGVPVIPSDLITICTDRDFIRVLERTYYPQTGPNIIPIPPSEKAVAFAIPGSKSPPN